MSALGIPPAALCGQDPPDLAALEARVAASRDDAEAHFALAQRLIEGVPGDRIAVIERMSAREQVRVTRLFEETLRHAPDEPRYLIGYAEWLAALGRELDGGRVAARAVRGLEEGPTAEPETDALLLAGYRVQARLLAGQVEDSRYLVPVRDLPVSSHECLDELFCQAYLRPGAFNSLLREAQEASSFPEGPRAELVELLERVFARDPADADALRALASERLAAEEWEDAARAARAHLAAAPGSAWARLVLGTALWRSGDRQRAAESLAAGFDALPESVRRAWRDPDRVLPSEAAGRLAQVDDTARVELGEAYWSRADPLLLTEENERWLEHLAREVYVELRFGVPERGLAGRDTDRGDVYLRLGHPLRVIQIDRDASKELDAEEIRAAFALMNCGPINSCQQQALRRAGPSRHGGGRWTFWVYFEQEAPFIFETPMRGREPRHKFETRSQELAEQVAREPGSLFQPPFGTADLAVQTARFRGVAAGETELVLAPEQPWTLEGAPVLRSGLFVVDTRSGRRLVERVADGAPQPLYALRLPAGARVRTRVEVMAGAEAEALDPVAGVPEGGAGGADTLAGPRPGHRGVTSTWEAVEDVAPWKEDLALSDLLLARRVAARGTTLASWRDLEIEPLSALRLEPGDSLGVVFEVYGLGVDGTLASYEVRVELAQPDGRSFAARAVRLLGRALGLADEPEATMLEWTRQAEPTNGRVVDYFVLVADELAGDSVELRIEVRDRLSGQAATATRTLTVEPRG